MGKATIPDIDIDEELDDAIKRLESASRRQLKLPKPRSFAEAVAACMLVHALRPFHGWTERETPALIGIVAPEEWIDTLRDVLDRILSDGKSYGTNAHIGAWKAEPRPFRDDRKDVLRMTRAFALVSDCDYLPQGFALAADGVAMIDRVDPRHVQAAAHRFLGVRMTAEDAVIIAAAPPDMMTALRKGRAIRDVLRRLRAAAAADDSAVPEVAQPRPESVAPTLDDLHGLGEAGEWGRELAVDLADWKTGRIAWDDVDRGILLSGPPGTGKTTFAGALARTCGVHLVLGSIGRWQAKGHLGDMLKAMRAAFDEARNNAPSIVFIDEIDAVGDREKFSDHNAQYCTEVVNALLECIDGAEGREGVIVVGACNHPDRLDAALVRAGRLDRHVVIPLPDAAGREGILRWHLKQALADEDLSFAAERTEGWSGAALEQLVRQARRVARRARRDMRLGDLLEELPSLVPVPAEALWRIAVHEAGHAVAGDTLGRWKIVAAEVLLAIPITTASHTHKSGGVVFMEDELFLSSAERYRDRIVRYFGGMAAEEVFFGERTDGGGGLVGSDLYNATVAATAMEASLGLGSGFAYLSGLSDEDLLWIVRHDHLVRARVEKTLSECYQRAVEIVRERRGDIERLAEALRDRGRLTGAEVVEVLDAQPQLTLLPRAS